MMSISDYTRLLAKESKTRNHELVEECIIYYGVYGLKELTEEQVKHFCRMKGLLQ